MEPTQAMTATGLNYAVQTTIVGAIILLAIVYLVYKATRKRNRNEGGCAGCRMSGRCEKEDRNEGGDMKAGESREEAKETKVR